VPAGALAHRDIDVEGLARAQVVKIPLGAFDRASLEPKGVVDTKPLPTPDQLPGPGPFPVPVPISPPLPPPAPPTDPALFSSPAITGNPGSLISGAFGSEKAAAPMAISFFD
jgi:hypothetical protein